jgi:hypothetical protein|tara:strand:- start:48895 stop:49911 length:1017 start_codon:yes stop_codon:yes gene_type:complete
MKFYCKKLLFIYLLINILGCSKNDEVKIFKKLPSSEKVINSGKIDSLITEFSKVLFKDKKMVLKNITDEDLLFYLEALINREHVSADGLFNSFEQIDSTFVLKCELNNDVEDLKYIYQTLSKKIRQIMDCYTEYEFYAVDLEYDEEDKIIYSNLLLTNPQVVYFGCNTKPFNIGEQSILHPDAAHKIEQKLNANFRSCGRIRTYGYYVNIVAAPGFAPADYYSVLDQISTPNCPNYASPMYWGSMSLRRLWCASQNIVLNGQDLNLSYFELLDYSTIVLQPALQNQFSQSYKIFSCVMRSHDEGTLLTPANYPCYPPHFRYDHSIRFYGGLLITPVHN